MDKYTLAAEGGKILKDAFSKSDSRVKVEEENLTERYKAKMENKTQEYRYDTATKMARMQEDLQYEELRLKRHVSNRCFDQGYVREAVQVLAPPQQPPPHYAYPMPQPQLGIGGGNNSPYPIQSGNNAPYAIEGGNN